MIFKLGIIIFGTFWFPGKYCPAFFYFSIQIHFCVLKIYCVPNNNTFKLYFKGAHCEVNEFDINNRLFLLLVFINGDCNWNYLQLEV